MALGAGDLAGILADLERLDEAVAITFGGLTITGILLSDHAVISDSLEGSQVSRVNALMIPADGLPGIAVDSEVTVDGTAYVVRDVILPDDRAVRVLLLA